MPSLPIAPWDPTAWECHLFDAAQGLGARKGAGWRGWSELHPWALHWSEAVCPIPEIAQQACFALLRDARRRMQDAIAATALVFDCDSGEDPTSLLVHLRLDGLAFAWWQTKRHTRETPRWRLVLPVARPIPIDRGDPGPFARVWRELARRLRSLGGGAFDEAGANPVHLWLGPIRTDQAHPVREIEWHEGAAIDWSVLALSAAPEPARVPRPGLAVDAQIAWSEEVRGRLVDAVAGAWPGPGSRHESCLALAHVMSRAGVPEDDIPLLVEDAADLAGDEEHHKRREAAESALVSRSEKQRGWPWLRAHVPDLADAMMPIIGRPDVEKLVASGEADTDRPGGPVDESLYWQQWSEQSNAWRLIKAAGPDWRYMTSVGHHWWTGQRWELDREEIRIKRASKHAASMIKAELKGLEGEDLKGGIRHLQRTQSAKGRAAMIELAHVEARVCMEHEDFDRDPYLLNCRNGAVDLHTGKLRPHAREDYCTRLVDVDYDEGAACPTWNRFLTRIMEGNGRLVHYLQILAGMALSGEVREHVFFVLYGTGSNGKGTFLRTLHRIMGEYAKSARMQTFLEQPANESGSAHSEDLARLAGARFVSAEEANPNRKLDIGRVKNLTGGDTITVRLPYSRYSFEFKPQFTLAIAVNHKPKIPSSDHGTWRRIKLIPFAATITEAERRAEPDLEAKLAAELPGILSWAVMGCRCWQAAGLEDPPEIRDATDAYRESNDHFARFVAEQCVVRSDLKVRMNALWTAYLMWCKENLDEDQKPLSQFRGFPAKLDELGFKALRTNVLRLRQGLALRDCPLVDEVTAGPFEPSPTDNPRDPNRDPKN